MFSINTPKRQAAFLAQIAVESEYLSVTIENLNYSEVGILATFPKEFSKVDATKYAHQPEQIANRAYAGKDGNGTEASGDGWRYRGRGLIQTSLLDNYIDIRDYLRKSYPATPDFAAFPELMAIDHWAALSAGGYWAKHNLNALADVGNIDGITRIINGPPMSNKLARQMQFAKAKKALGI